MDVRWQLWVATYGQGSSYISTFLLEKRLDVVIGSNWTLRTTDLRWVETAANLECF